MIGEQPGEMPGGDVRPALPQAAVSALVEALFDEAPGGLALLDCEQRVVRVNAQLERIADRTADEMVGRSAAEALPGLYGHRFEAAARDVLSGAPPVLDAHLVLGEGEEQRHLALSCYALHLGGQLAGAAVMVNDVTTPRRREELHARLLAIASHDLKTPLVAIRLSAQTLLRGSAEPRVQRMLRAILASATRVEGIVRDLVDYAIAQRGGAIPVSPSPADLALLCQGVAEECQAASPDRMVECEGEGDPKGEWDADRLAQAVSNLVSNALRYGDPASPVRLHWHGEWADVAAIEVRNAGPPIPAEVLPELFAAFRRGPGEERGRGLGLGLYIAREIAAAHGGRLEARSTAEEGTTFTIVVPRRALH
jgi:signal transduction histidine kinase